MQFELTDELTDDIISAMENQDVEYAVDAQEGQLVISDSDGHIPDDERYYILPEWGPSDGFGLREDFVNNLHAPLAREELQNAMHSGRGVFKNFRNTLKNYPEIDKRWHIFKHRFMSARINEWYNSLREIWGLEKLDQLPESDETLVHDDFSFKVYDSEADKKTILLNVLAKMRLCRRMLTEHFTDYGEPSLKGRESKIKPDISAPVFQTSLQAV